MEAVNRRAGKIIDDTVEKRDENVSCVCLSFVYGGNSKDEKIRTMIRFVRSAMIQNTSII